MRKSSCGVYRRVCPGAANEPQGSLRPPGRARARFGFLLSLAALPSTEAAAASPMRPDVVLSATPSALLTREVDWWNVLQRLSNEQDAQELRAVLAPDQWIELPIISRRGPRGGAQ